MNKVFFGDCRDSMRQMIADGVKVQMCVTSSPYFGLRDYGHPGQLGLESTPDEFIANLVEVFRLVRELLADDGTLWANIGDSYASGQSNNGGCSPKSTLSGGGGRYRENSKNEAAFNVATSRKINCGVKPKDLIGIPWMLAFALRADGWYLRQDIIWHKPNPMPESVTDRCTKSHEYIFLLSKSAKYYYDADAIKTPLKDSSVARLIQDVENQEGSDRVPGKTNGKMKAVKFGGNKYGDDESEQSRTKSGKEWNPKMAGGGAGVAGHSGYFDANGNPLCGAFANKKSVWTVNTKGYSGAHFATYPPELIEPCILAGSRPGDIVLDPFFGSGTTGQVCESLGRQWIGCELNQDYEVLQKSRTAQQGMMFV